MLFVIDSVIKSNIEMHLTNTVCTPVPQQDIIILWVGIEGVSLDRILWRLVES